MRILPLPAMPLASNPFKGIGAIRARRRLHEFFVLARISSRGELRSRCIASGARIL